MHGVVEVSLPGAPGDEGRRLVDARVRPLCGHDQERLLGAVPSLDAHSRDTALLARAVERLGPHEPPGASALDELTVGDRQVLLWTARRETFGDRVDLVIDCAACAGKLDVTVGASDLLTGSGGDRQPERDEHQQPERDETVGGRQVRHRLPTGADQAAIAAEPDPDAALSALLERIVGSVDGHPPAPGDLAELAVPLAERLAELDPNAETVLEVSCPECGARTETLLEAGAILLEEAVAGAQWLVQEVHVLAWHYHWSEHDILSLPVSRRRRYLELVEAAGAGTQG